MQSCMGMRLRWPFNKSVIWLSRWADLKIYLKHEIYIIFFNVEETTRKDFFLS